jgi:predicted DNA-binding protein with PD1-like motif
VQVRRTDYGFALRLDPGEEIIAALKAFALAHGVRAGVICGLGAVGEAEVGFFDRFEKKYLTRTFTGEHEIGSLTGNFSELDGQPFPHCHILLSGPDLVGYTGHLFRGVVTVTCEMQVIVTPGRFLRVRHPAEGFNPLDLDESAPDPAAHS